jgi:hypothetical protein
VEGQRGFIGNCRAFSKYESPAKQASDSRPPCKKNPDKEHQDRQGRWAGEKEDFGVQATPNPDFEKALLEIAGIQGA